MTAEFGDHDATPTLRQRFAGISIVGAVALVNYVSDDAYGRYDRDTARLSLYGESEDAGDGFQRGREVSDIASIAMLGPLLPVMLLLGFSGGLAELVGPLVALPVSVLGFVSGVYALANVGGLMGLTTKISVVDHTTEPAPDALDDLQQQYVDGEIDEQELNERAAEVWQR